MRRSACVCLAALLWCAAAPAKEEWRAAASGDVIVRYRPRDERKAEQVLSAIGRMRQELRDELGVDFRRRAEVVLARGARDFEEAAGPGIPGWALAIARAKEGGIVVDVSRAGPLLENNLLLTLRHELCHLVLGQAEEEAGAALPLWFHEGLATWLSGASHVGEREAFLVAAAHGHLLPLARLEGAFPADAEEARLAYLQSEDFVAWLAAQPGGAPGRILEEFRARGDFPAAVRAATGRTVEELEAAWRAARRSPNPWLTTLRHALSLFTVLAVGTVLAYLIQRARRRRIRERWQREERTLARLRPTLRHPPDPY